MYVILSVCLLGLRKYWRGKRGIGNTDESDDELPNVWTLPQHHAEEVQLRQVHLLVFLLSPKTSHDSYIRLVITLT